MDFFGILNTQTLHQQSCHWNAINFSIWQDFITQEKIKCYVRKEKELNRGLLLYACEVLVDDEPIFNETIMQKTTKCRRTKWKHSVLSPEMFLNFLYSCFLPPQR